MPTARPFRHRLLPVFGTWLLGVGSRYRSDSARCG
jgi:hypothetical protein